MTCPDDGRQLHAVAALTAAVVGMTSDSDAAEYDVAGPAAVSALSHVLDPACLPVAAAEPSPRDSFDPFLLPRRQHSRSLFQAGPAPWHVGDIPDQQRPVDDVWPRVRLLVEQLWLGELDGIFVLNLIEIGYEAVGTSGLGVLAGAGKSA